MSTTEPVPPLIVEPNANRRNWWRQGMMGSVLAHTEGINAFSETNFAEDLNAIDVPTLLLHGEDDQNSADTPGFVQSGAATSNARRPTTRD